MKRRLIRWLVCPRCRGDLQIRVANGEKAPISESDRATLAAIATLDASDEIELDIATGALTCDRCRVYYPVHNGVPRMLTYPTRVAEVHAKENAAWISEHLAGFRLPDG